MKDKIAIIGLGYVGLPLAVAFAEKYQVVGFDINKNRVKELNEGFDHTHEISEKELLNVNDNIKYSYELTDIKDVNGIVENPTWRLQ